MKHNFPSVKALSQFCDIAKIKDPNLSKDVRAALADYAVNLEYLTEFPATKYEALERIMIEASERIPDHGVGDGEWFNASHKRKAEAIQLLEHYRGRIEFRKQEAKAIAWRIWEMRLSCDHRGVVNRMRLSSLTT
jgi:hypothetical protein